MPTWGALSWSSWGARLLTRGWRCSAGGCARGARLVQVGAALLHRRITLVSLGVCRPCQHHRLTIHSRRCAGLSPRRHRSPPRLSSRTLRHAVPHSRRVRRLRLPGSLPSLQGLLVFFPACVRVPSSRAHRGAPLQGACDLFYAAPSFPSLGRPLAMDVERPYNPRAPARVLALRRAVGDLLDMLRFFGLASGPPPRATLTVDMPVAAPLGLFFVAAELTVDWANIAARTGSGAAGGLCCARPAPVPQHCVAAALLVSCRACALSLVKDGLMAEDDDDGTPFGISLEGLDPVCRADAYAVSAAAMASRAVWAQVPYWEDSTREADLDSESMQEAIEAARAPLPGETARPASADSFPRLVSQAAVACAPVPYERQGRSAAVGRYTAPAASGAHGHVERQTGAGAAGPSTAPSASAAGRAESSESSSDGASSGGAARADQERPSIGRGAEGAATEAAPSPAVAAASTSGSTSASPYGPAVHRRSARPLGASATDGSSASSTATTSTTSRPVSGAA